ncbi:MAG: CcdB family protein [Mariprofundaceae bacterium]
MEQFTLYKNNGASQDVYPLFVDVQNDLLDSLSSRVVIPLTPIDHMEKKSPSHLCPIINLDQGDFVLLTHQMTSVPASILTSSAGSLDMFRSEIISAIDFLITEVRC